MNADHSYICIFTVPTPRGNAVLGNTEAVQAVDEAEAFELLSQSVDFDEFVNHHGTAYEIVLLIN